VGEQVEMHVLRLVAQRVQRRMLMRPIANLTAVVFLALSLVSCSSQQGPGVNLPGHPTAKELSEMVASARTKADHLVLAAHFRQEASDLREERREHEEIGHQYVEGKYRNCDPTAYEHCKKIAEGLALAADNAYELARLHEEMAKSSPQQ